MKSKFSQIFITIFMLLMSHTASASYISYNGYTLDEESNIVTGDGLEWLQWDETISMSITEALAEYSAAGWRLASNEEMASLLTTFVSSTDSSYEWSADEHDITYYVSSEETFIESVSELLELFGITYQDSTTDFIMSEVIFGSDEDKDGQYKTAQAMTSSWITQILTQYFNTTEDESNNINSVALVREVPEPGMVLIFALGLLLIAGRNRFSRS